MPGGTVADDDEPEPPESPCVIPGIRDPRLQAITTHRTRPPTRRIARLRPTLPPIMGPAAIE